MSTAGKHLPGIVDSLEGLGTCCLEYCQYRCEPPLLRIVRMIYSLHVRTDITPGLNTTLHLCANTPKGFKTMLLLDHTGSENSRHSVYGRPPYGTAYTEQHWVQTSRIGALLWPTMGNPCWVSNETDRDAISLFKRALARNVEVKDLPRDARLFRLLERGHRRMIDEVRPKSRKSP